MPPLLHALRYQAEALLRLLHALSAAQASRGPSLWATPTLSCVTGWTTPHLSRCSLSACTGRRHMRRGACSKAWPAWASAEPDQCPSQLGLHNCWTRHCLCSGLCSQPHEISCRVVQLMPCRTTGQACQLYHITAGRLQCTTKSVRQTHMTMNTCHFYCLVPCFVSRCERIILQLPPCDCGQARAVLLWPGVTPSVQCRLLATAHPLYTMRPCLLPKATAGWCHHVHSRAELTHEYLRKDVLTYTMVLLDERLTMNKDQAQAMSHKRTAGMQAFGTHL